MRSVPTAGVNEPPKTDFAKNKTPSPSYTTPRGGRPRTACLRLAHSGHETPVHCEPHGQGVDSPVQHRGRPLPRPNNGQASGRPARMRWVSPRSSGRLFSASISRRNEARSKRSSFPPARLIYRNFPSGRYLPECLSFSRLRPLLRSSLLGVGTNSPAGVPMRIFLQLMLVRFPSPPHQDAWHPGRSSR